jgi:hypothetical protein
LTTLVTQYGSLGFHIDNIPHLMPLLHASNNPVTGFMMDIYSADWFITTGILANMAALGWLAFETFRSAFRAPVVAGNEAGLTPARMAATRRAQIPIAGGSRPLEGEDEGS